MTKRTKRGAEHRRDESDRHRITRRGRRPRQIRVAVPAAVTLILLGHALLADTSTRHKCTTFDEIAHLTKGYAWWRSNDHRLLPEHPPLAQAWAALPLLDDGLRFPSAEQPAWHRSAVFTLGKQFFYRMGNDSDAMLRSSRRMIILLSLALGIVVFLWSKKLFGLWGGLISLVLYAFSPTMLAHARLVTTDLCVSLFFLLAVASLWWVLHEVRPASLVAGCVTVSGLLLAKMSCLLIAPVALILILVRLAGGRPLTVWTRRERPVRGRPRLAIAITALVLTHALVVWLAIWAAFGFRYQAMVDAQPGRDRFFTPGPVPEGKTVWEHQGRGIPVTAAAVAWARDHRLLPESYLYGLLYTVQSARGRDAFLDGERRITGWWRFFPLCFLYKVPLPTMGVMIVAMLAFVLRKPCTTRVTKNAQSAVDPDVAESLYGCTPLFALLAVYWAFAISSHLNIGHRHLLPVFAPMFVLCGAAALHWTAAAPRWRAILGGLLVMTVATSLRSWPHYLAHFNLIAGGPSHGYRHLVDSSLDWGQDLPGLKRWIDANRPDENVYVSYFGTGDLGHYGIDVAVLPKYLARNGAGDYGIRGGWFCVSATRLQQVYLLPTTEWTAALERSYQRDRAEMLDFEATADDAAARWAALESKGRGFKRRFDHFQKLRFGRLCAYLRQREPDDHVGYTILIYHLTDAEVDSALNGPPP